MIENSLAELYPDIAAEWDFIANAPLTPKDITCGSTKRVSWVCKFGHKWTTSIYKRTGGSACPYCCGRLAVPGETDLATLYPNLAAEWHPSLNGDLRPTMITAGSKKKVYWLCNNNHVWQAVISERVRGSGCPYCHNKRVCSENCLSTIYPHIASEWHPTKNGSLTPKDVMPCSHKKVWWMCARGHEWQASIYSRKRNGCPICSNKKIIAGINDLATTDPWLTAQWHPMLNNNLTPQMVSCASSKKVWWICPKGHEWNATINSRHNGANCPVCSGRVVSPGINDLQTLAPEIAAEWHPTKNGSLQPSSIAAGSGYNAWWKCSFCGYEWQAPVTHRYHRLQQCPACKEKIPPKDRIV